MGPPRNIDRIDHSGAKFSTSGMRALVAEIYGTVEFQTMIRRALTTPLELGPRFCMATGVALAQTWDSILANFCFNDSPSWGMVATGHDLWCSMFPNFLKFCASVCEKWFHVCSLKEVR